MCITKPSVPRYRSRKYTFYPESLLENQRAVCFTSRSFVLVSVSFPFQEKTIQFGSNSLGIEKIRQNMIAGYNEET